MIQIKVRYFYAEATVTTCAFNKNIFPQIAVELYKISISKYREKTRSMLLYLYLFLLSVNAAGAKMKGLRRQFTNFISKIK